jgi:osmotically-inducible protein OsmY
LTGVVDERRAKRLAEDIAASVSGVRDVHNRLRVQEAAVRPL